MRFISIIIFFLICIAQASAQLIVLSGRVFHKNEGVPFATVLVKGSTYAATSNVDGRYTLKLNPGKYEIVFQSIGYAKHSELIELTHNQELNVELKPDGILLKEIDISAGEDPSYPIIRNAIKRRNYYQEQISEYSCKAYIKGLQKIEEMPKNITGLIKLFGGQLSDTNNLKGVIYLSESESKYFFKKPEEKEIMFSSKVSGDNRTFSFHKLSDMKLSFYDNLVDLGSLSDRPLVSPINENAFLFYRYFLQGTINEDGKIIHKIKMVPKRKTDPCFSGMIYIQDSTWRITSIDVKLTKEVKIKYVDTLYIKQLHASVIGDSVWMPVSLNFSFDFKVFGFKGGGYFNASVSDYDMNPNLTKSFFKNEILLVQDGSNRKDSLYWIQNRPIPLTEEEVKDYSRKDSLEKIYSSDTYKDSVDRVRNRPKMRNVLFGYRYNRTKKNLQVNLPGIVTNGIQYNTVEGLNLSYKFSIDKTYENLKQQNVSGKLRYGFSNKLWGGEIGYNYLMNPIKRTVLGFKVKSITEQFNQQEPIIPLVNSFYTLFLNENYLKLFRETGAEAYYAQELINGLYFYTSCRYMERNSLSNTSDKLLIDDLSKKFTSNDPQNELNEAPAFITNSALTAEVVFNIRFKQKFQSLPQQKIVSGSKYPRLNFGYKKAIPVNAISADYDLLTAGLRDAVKLGLFGTFRYKAATGIFINNRRLYFMDYRHFPGNQTIINTNDNLGSYRLLPYYAYSAEKHFAEVHVEHHFQGIILGQIPLLKKFLAQEVVGAHFLNNNNIEQYFEFNFGLEKIYRVFRVDYVFNVVPGQKIKHGFTINLNLAL